MRDALSIMDQAIASAPTVDGHPALEATQVRELMGSVSNVVYEQILEAVHYNNSADVLAVIGRLLDAGNGAPQLARQFVRYLRNTVVAKITNLSPNAEATGVAADLLQISPEERNRAARSAALFTEEELSRFLSIMLRTFDELGYRQEQRFHLELGLLKLVHVQRLVPVEELLSQLGSKPSSQPQTKTTSTSAQRAGDQIGGPSFPASSERVASGSATAAKSPTMAATSGSMALAPAPIAESHAGPHLVPSLQASAKLETAPPLQAPGIAVQPVVAEPIVSTPIVTAPIKSEPITAAPIDSPADDNLAALHTAFVSALSAIKGQQSASEQIEDSTLAIVGDTLEIQTNLSKNMLPVGINAEAEKILNATLRTQNMGISKLRLLAGAGTPATVKKARPAQSGSAAELAEKHPIVQQAKTLFSAEISNIIDLRD
jgi:DNA polymerase-3 subunit gamma/tau